MGVHDVENTYPQIKKLLGIPEDEPIFIIRAQDKHSLAIVNRYKLRVMEADTPTDDWIADMQTVEEEFTNWQTENRDKVKSPD